MITKEKLIKYQVQYNQTNKTWNVYKYIETEHSFNFYSIFKGTKQECLDKKAEVEKANGKNSKAKVHKS